MIERVYPHAGVPDSCVGCHVGDTTRPTGGHSFKLLPRPADPASSCLTELGDSLARLGRSSVTGTCRQCHGILRSLDAKARGDYDGDGAVEGIVTEVEGLLRALRQELERQIRELDLEGAGGAKGVSFTLADEVVVVADAECRPLRKASGVWLTLAAGAPLLHKAAYNYLLIVRDGSGGIHNPQYTVRLLQNAIEGLLRARGIGARQQWKSPR